MLLRKLETMLHELYALEVGYAVSDFLITDAALAGSFDAGGRMVDEKLLIAEANGEADVALYLEQALLDRLAERDPLMRLDGENLADFWAALEGVSHFTYYAWNAARDKSVSLFELELQAEVDKFVTTRRLLREQNGREPGGLHGWLFDSPTLAAELDEEERERYQRANRYAAKYCRRLSLALAAEHAAAVQRELRHFYRLTQASKVAHIDAN
jgi:hypothetical protein